MEKAYTQYVFPAFEKLYGAKVVVVPGTSSDILAKAQANKDRPQSRAQFVRITGAGLRESHVHDVTITKEAPNYRVSR